MHDPADGVRPGPSGPAADAVLVIGVDGLIGSRLWARLVSSTSPGQIRGTSRRAHPSGAISLLDLERLGEGGDLPVSLGHWLASIRGSRLVVFATASVTGFDRCASWPEASRRVNVDAMARLARLLVPYEPFIAFISSSAVFGEPARAPTEATDVDPSSEYGRQKVQAERVLLDAGNTGVLRVTKVLSTAQPLIARWIEALQQGAAIEAAADLYLAPVSVPCVLDALMVLGSTRACGVHHLSGAEELSYFELGTRLAGALGRSPALVRPVCLARAEGAVSSRPCSLLGMDGSRLGLTPQAPDAVIQHLMLESRDVERAR